MSKPSGVLTVKYQNKDTKMEAVRIVESKNKNRIVAFCNPKMMQQNGFTATTIQESIEFFNAIGNATAFFNSCINEFLLPLKKIVYYIGKPQKKVMKRTNVLW